jgi:hypothetical protein
MGLLTAEEHEGLWSLIERCLRGIPPLSIALGTLAILLQRLPAVVFRRVMSSADWDDEADALGPNATDDHIVRLHTSYEAAKIELVRARGYRVVTA